jgi:hypothetical protein
VSSKYPFKRLASELIAHGVQSEYMARVEARISREQQLESVQAELTQEIAGSLGRADLQVNLALAELELCRARYDQAHREGAPQPAQRALAEAYNQQRAVAQTRLRALQIQREAIGFRRNQILLELYPIPSKLPLD